MSTGTGQTATPAAPPAFALADNDEVPVTLAGKDAKGQSSLAGVTGIAWTVDNEAVATVAASTTTGHGAVVKAVAVGDATVTATGTLADGTTFSATLAVQVTAGPATEVAIAAGTPTVEPAPAPTAGAQPAS